MLWHLQNCSSSSASREAGISVPADFHGEMVRFQLFRHNTFKGKHSARTQNLSPGTNSSLRDEMYQHSCSPEAIFSSSQADFTPHYSPHCVEVIVRRHIVFIITGQTQLVPITLVDKVPELLWTERLKEGTENSIHFHPRILKYNENIFGTIIARSITFLALKVEVRDSDTALMEGDSLLMDSSLLNSSDATRWTVCYWQAGPHAG